MTAGRRRRTTPAGTPVPRSVGPDHALDLAHLFVDAPAELGIELLKRLELLDVFDGDDGLGGKCLHEADLVGPERRHVVLVETDHADALPVGNQGHEKRCAHPFGVDRVAQLGRVELRPLQATDVVILRRGRGIEPADGNRPVIVPQRDRVGPQEVEKPGRRKILCRDFEMRARRVRQLKEGMRRAAQMSRVFEDRFEDRLFVAVGPADDFQNFLRRILTLPHAIEFGVQINPCGIG